MEALIVAVLAALGLGAFAFARGRRQGAAVAAQARVKAKAEVAAVEDVRVAERRAERGSELARQVQRIHTETKAAVASRKADRADARRLLQESQWDDSSGF